jgi:hypothetical protein
MPKSSEAITWKRLTYITDRTCEGCGEPVKMNQGLVSSFRRKRVRHLWCGPKVILFLSYGDEAAQVIEAAISDYQESHRPELGPAHGGLA